MPPKQRDILYRFTKRPEKWVNGLGTYTPQDSYKWNKIEIPPAKIQDDFFKVMRELRAAVESGEMSSDDFNELELTFSIPTDQGDYNLIPDGWLVTVYVEAAREYFLRLEYEHRKAETLSTRAIEMSASSSKVINVAPPPRRNTSVSELRQRVSCAPVYLEAVDIEPLEELKTSAKQLLEHPSISSEDFERLGIMWSIQVPHRTPTCVISLFPGGDETPVTYSNLPRYFSKVVNMVTDIQQQIASSGVYPVPADSVYQPTASVMSVSSPGSSQYQSQVVSGEEDAAATGNGSSIAETRQREEENERVQQRRMYAVPPPVPASDFDLFSPTHTTANLLAPPSALNR